MTTLIKTVKGHRATLQVVQVWETNQAHASSVFDVHEPSEYGKCGSAFNSSIRDSTKGTPPGSTRLSRAGSSTCTRKGLGDVSLPEKDLHITGHSVQ